MLESVLTKGGTAPLARVPGYRVTGKTGTVRIVGVHGYEKHRYNSIFIGIALRAIHVSSLQLCCMIQKAAYIMVVIRQDLFFLM